MKWCRIHVMVADPEEQLVQLTEVLADGRLGDPHRTPVRTLHIMTGIITFLRRPPVQRDYQDHSRAYPGQDQRCVSSKRSVWHPTRSVEEPEKYTEGVFPAQGREICLSVSSHDRDRSSDEYQGRDHTDDKIHGRESRLRLGIVVHDSIE